MKKFLVLFLTVLFAVISCFSVACSGENEESDFVKNTKNIYKVYADYVKEKGEEPLTYEEWLESIKGEKGDKGEGIVNAYFNEQLELILVLDNGEINCGQIALKLEKTVNNFVLKVNCAQKILKDITDMVSESMGEKLFIDAIDFVNIFVEKYNDISEYFSVKEQIAEIYDALEGHEYYEEISAVMTAYQELEQTFVKAISLTGIEFLTENTRKSDTLSQKVNILLLLILQ